LKTRFVGCDIPGALYTEFNIARPQFMPMDKLRIGAEIRRFVARESGIAEGNLPDDADLFRDGILDSLMVVSLVSFCEEKFRVDLSGQDFSEEDLRTIAALSTMVAERVGLAEGVPAQTGNVDELR